VLQGADVTENFMMRQAGTGDAEVLATICRESFSGSLLWNGPRFLARDWWKAVIQTSSAETWVCLQDNEVSAFCVLVKDKAQWSGEPLPFERTGLIKLLAGVMCPGLLLSKLARMVRPAQYPRSECQGHQGVALADDSLLWIRLLAVSPRHRRQGIAKAMLQLCERRTRELQRKVVQLFVFSTDQPARHLYLQQGFLCTNHKKNGCVMMKALE
jgi:ribosomal protein S18 acetylase RimI-like enzyme